jgi:hypothetical protein
MVERREPRQLWRLWWWLRDLIEVKQKEEKLGQKYEKYKFN